MKPVIVGIGLDMIEIERILKACEKESFLNRCFTEKEIALIREDKKKAAGNFAVKEAVSKVFGTGFRGVSFPEIEVLRDDAGKPYVNLHGRAKELAARIGADYIHVSITDTKEMASAIAIGESRKNEQ